MPKVKPGSKRRILKGWAEIAAFLGQTVSVAQRWQNGGMPVTREGRSVYAFSEALTAWVSGVVVFARKVQDSATALLRRFPQLQKGHRVQANLPVVSKVPCYL